MNNSYKKAMDKIELSEGLKEKIVSSASSQPSHIKPIHIKRLAGIAACLVLCLISCYAAFYAAPNFYSPAQPSNTASVDAPEQIQNSEALSEKTAASEPAQEQPAFKSPAETAVESPTPAYEKADISSNQGENREPVTVAKPPADKGLQATATEPSADKGLPAMAKGKVAAKDTPENQPATPEELSAILGYEIKALKEAPAGYEAANMRVAGEGIAEIIYRNEHNTITYRTAKLSADLSKSGTACEFMEIVSINNTDVAFKGIGDLYYSAVWLEGDYAFSITSEGGIEKAAMVDMVSGAFCTEK